MNRRYEAPAWIDYLEDKLLEVHEARCSQESDERVSQPGKRLIITVPPRHGKSTLASHHFPAWWLGRHPEDRVLLCSYAAEFAATFGEKAKTVMQELGPFVFKAELSHTVAGRSNWELAMQPHMHFAGGMSTAGVGGPITGKGANLLIIDDPVKNAEEAHSETYRDKSWEWLTSTALTRLEPGGSAILIMTRWHHDDLAGRLIRNMEEGGEEWKLVNFPAIAEADEYWPDGRLFRTQGEALFPERYPVERLDAIRTNGTLSSYWWASLYQQRPSPEEGGHFKSEWFRYFQKNGDILELRRPDGSIKRVSVTECQRFSTVDLATSTKETADYTVIATWLMTKQKELLLLDLERKRMEGPDIVPALQRVWTRFRPVLWIESGGFQTNIVQYAQRAGLPVKELRADTDKLTRSMVAQARMEAGMVYFRGGAAWLPELEDELLMFPNGAHDDQVDVVSYAAIVAAENQGSPLVIEKFLR